MQLDNLNSVKIVFAIQHIKSNKIQHANRDSQLHSFEDYLPEPTRRNITGFSSLSRWADRMLCCLSRSRLQRGCWNWRAREHLPPSPPCSARCEPSSDKFLLGHRRPGEDAIKRIRSRGSSTRTLRVRLHPIFHKCHLAFRNSPNLYRRTRQSTSQTYMAFSANLRCWRRGVLKSFRFNHINPGHLCQISFLRGRRMRGSVRVWHGDSG